MIHSYHRMQWFSIFPHIQVSQQPYDMSIGYHLLVSDRNLYAEWLEMNPEMKDFWGKRLQRKQS
jgi:hypothetical protein